MKKSMYDIIKKQNGEAFAQEIRRTDSGIFDIQNLDKIVRYAGRDAKPLLPFLFSLKGIKIKEQEEHQDPIELLAQAGYDAYYADSFQKQNAIRKYFARGEELCTFGDAKRYKKYHIINAVKKNVDEIKREDFKHPEREDEYGTSVISIQILKTGGFISIKNRYNHRVSNPDNTFGSNPDNIIEGLSDAIKHLYSVDFSSQQEFLPEFYSIAQGHVFKYHFENCNLYFGKDFYVEKGDIYPINKDCELMMDNMIFNIKEKKFYSPISFLEPNMRLLTQQVSGKKLSIDTYKDENKVTHHVISTKDGTLFDVAEGRLRRVILPEIEEVQNYFLSDSEALSYFSAPKLKKVGDSFLMKSSFLKNLSLPEVVSVGDEFLKSARELEELDMPKLEWTGQDFLSENRKLKKLSLPLLNYVGPYFLDNNEVLEDLNLPSLVSADCYFCAENEKLTTLSLPNLTDVGEFFLVGNESLESVYLPNLKRAGDSFLMANKALRNISLPSLLFLGSDFMFSNDNFVADFPRLKEERCVDKRIRRLMPHDKCRNIQVLVPSILQHQRS